MEQHHGNGITDEQVPLLQPTNPLNDGDSTTFLQRACDAITAFLTFLGIWSTIFFTICGQWLIVVLIFILGLMFIIPLTPAFTLHSISTSASILNITAGEKLFTTNLGVLLYVDHSNPIGSRIHYDDSLHASLFHRQQRKMISTFFLPRQQEQSAGATTIKALFPNASLMVDEWTSIMDHGSSCGYVYLDLWFNASARFTPVVNVKDKLQGHCGEVKVQLCSSSSVTAATTVVHPFHALCNVHSDVVYRVKLVLIVMLIFLVAIVVVVYHFIGNSLFTPMFTPFWLIFTFYAVLFS